jgi:hypothetical protein
VVPLAGVLVEPALNRKAEGECGLGKKKLRRRVPRVLRVKRPLYFWVL